jgi:hypothetical protein
VPRGKIVLVAAIGLAGAILAGCEASMPHAVSNAPEVDEFPEEELPFRVGSTQETTVRAIQDHLVQRGLPSVVTLRAPKTFIVTTYFQEPKNEADRRVRRTAIRLAVAPLQPTGSSACTSVAVVTLTKSRGIHEELWSRQESDTAFTSNAWPEIKALLSKRLCT